MEATQRFAKGETICCASEIFTRVKARSRIGGPVLQIASKLRTYTRSAKCKKWKLLGPLTETHHDRTSSKALASLRSRVSKPSVNQP